MLRITLERSAASSGKLVQKHAPIFIFSGGCSDFTVNVFRSGSLIFLIDSTIAIDMLGKIVASASIAAVILLILLLSLTSPTEAGPLGVLACFILFYIAVLGAATFLIHGLSRLVVKFSTSITIRRPIQAISFRKSYYYGTVVALLPVMLVGMQSVGSIGFYEILLVVIFGSIGCLYVAKRMS